MSSSSNGRPRVAVILSGWPRVSESFALNEVLALKRAGMLAAVLALKTGDGGPPHPAAAELEPLVEVLPPGDVDAQAEAAVQRLDGIGISAVHGYFAHAPAAVAAAVASKFGVPYGFSVHALDARKVPRDELGERARGAALVVACNDDAAAEVEAAGTTPTVVRHGVDLVAFPATRPAEHDPVQLLAVGRLVEKKGFEVLLEALSRLDRPYRLRLVGDGPLRPALTALIDAHRLADRVELVGRCTHATLPEYYASADVVVVPSVVDSAGDRDGLPNVVLESMASQRPVVASEVAAIPSAVRDGVTGTLVPPRDPDALAAAIAALIDSPARRAELGRGARAVAETEFGLTSRTEEFCRVLERAYG
ncbi:MAG TPA: glycosyltransferase [Mycobacteriales bacterium]|jgi:glycosyltransferase involved in cell wall biosynthesis|nr:glycosyltransferase [Mycobacteriales bacterium]